MARIVVLALLVACIGCTGRTTFRWQPTLVSQVPDSMTVRFVPASGEKPVTGRSLGWQSGQPRVINTRGDTLTVSTGSRVSVKAKGKVGHPLAGAVIGWGIGIGISRATCDGLRMHCGEQDPTPLISASLGALIGAVIKTDRWVRLYWGQ